MGDCGFLRGSELHGEDVKPHLASPGNAAAADEMPGGSGNPFLFFPDHPEFGGI